MNEVAKSFGAAASTARDTNTVLRMIIYGTRLRIEMYVTFVKIRRLSCHPLTASIVLQMHRFRVVPTSHAIQFSIEDYIICILIYRSVLRLQCVIRSLTVTPFFFTDRFFSNACIFDAQRPIHRHIFLFFSRPAYRLTHLFTASAQLESLSSSFSPSASSLSPRSCSCSLLDSVVDGVCDMLALRARNSTRKSFSCW